MLSCPNKLLSSLKILLRSLRNSDSTARFSADSSALRNYLKSTRKYLTFNLDRVSSATINRTSFYSLKPFPSKLIFCLKLI